MADIQAYLDAIENAVYGEDVRGSIHDAIEIINDVGEKVITAGTAVTSPSSSVEGFFEDSLYFNTNTDDLWQCTGTGWTLLGNLKGSQGNPGNPGQAATIAVGTVTKGDNASVVNSGTSSAAVFDFVLPKGDPGPAGVNTWGSITGDIDDQTDLKNALGDVYAQGEELVDRTVGWVCNNLFDIEAVEMGKDIYGEAAANAALFTLNCKPSTRYYLSVHGTNNLQVSYNTTALGPTEVLIASFPYDFSTTEYDTYIKICFTKSGLTKSDIEALKFMLSEVANAPYSEHHPPVSDVITDVYGVMGENGAKNINKTVYTSPYVNNGLTFTTNSDKSVSVNGTLTEGQSTAQVEASASGRFTVAENIETILNGGYDSTLGVFVYDYTDNARPYKDSSKTERATDLQYGDNLFPVYLEAGHSYGVIVRATASVDNKTVYPMIRDARDTNPDYEPYAMTNRELTDAVNGEALSLTTTQTLKSGELNSVIRMGRIVCVCFAFENVTADAYTTLASVPASIKPSGILYFNANGTSMYIDSNGSIKNTTALNNANIRGAFVYNI